MKKIVFFFLCLIIFTKILSAQKYIAPNGDDANPGTIAQPFATFSKAIAEAMSGDTIYVRGGTYNLTTTITISSAKSGTEDQPMVLSAFN
ncbi:DUF1565 domain-containing protein, partial [candidate division KSB1 bacterium]